MIILDPGHGGLDHGAVGPTIIEKDFSLKLSQYMAQRLKDMGIPYTITRDSDIDLPKDQRITRIKELAGNTPDVVLFSNHLNEGAEDGAEIVYALRDKSTLSDLIAVNFMDAGQNIRKVSQKTQPEDLSKDYYYIHRESPNNVEPVLIEYGFVDSTKDDIKQLTNNWEQLTEAVLKAYTTYKNLPYTPPIKKDTYIVKPGDSLYSIAKKFQTTTDHLKSLNTLTTNLLLVGQELMVPETTPIINTYDVQPGNNLYSIANEYDTTVDELKSLNHLTSDLLQVNQGIKIPSTTPAVPIATRHIVQEGDSLYVIANQYETTVDEIRKLNHLTSNLLSIGQVLNIQ